MFCDMFYDTDSVCMHLDIQPFYGYWLNVSCIPPVFLTTAINFKHAHLYTFCLHEKFLAPCLLLLKHQDLFQPTQTQKDASKLFSAVLYSPIHC